MPPSILPLTVFLAALLVGSLNHPRHHNQLCSAHHGFMLRVSAEGRARYTGDDTVTTNTPPSVSGRDAVLEHRGRAEAQRNRTAARLGDLAGGNSSGGHDDDGAAAGVQTVTTRGVQSAPTATTPSQLRGASADDDYDDYDDYDYDYDRDIISSVDKCTMVTYDERRVIITNCDNPKCYPDESKARLECNSNAECKGYWAHHSDGFCVTNVVTEGSCEEGPAKVKNDIVCRDGSSGALPNAVPVTYDIDWQNLDTNCGSRKCYRLETDAQSACNNDANCKGYYNKIQQGSGHVVLNKFCVTNVLRRGYTGSCERVFNAMIKYAALMTTPLQCGFVGPY